jgi:metacaspase-1
MVRPLQAGVRLTAIFDSCHSGTALDLPYIYSTQGILKEPNLAKEAGQGLLGVLTSYSQGDLGGVANNILGFIKKATNGEEAHTRALATKTSPADVIMLSGSKDDQTSWVSPFSYYVPHHYTFPPSEPPLSFLYP